MTKRSRMPQEARSAAGGGGDKGRGADAPPRGAGATATGIPVHFSGAEIVDIADLKAYPRNNRAHGDEQVALLAKNIRANGWRWPIIVSRRSGYIVAGHGRLEAARLLNVATVPVVYQDFDSAKAEEAFRLADNRLPELAEQQTAIIADLLGELQAGGDFDMDLTGYTEKMREQMMTAAADVPPDAETPTLRAVLTFPPRVWLVQSADVRAAVESAIEPFGGACEWPE